MTAYIFDTETTGLDDPEIIEAAWLEIKINMDCGVEEGQRFKPEKEITFGAMAIHHIVPGDLVGCPPSSSFKLPADAEYLIGHNIDFDWRAIGEPNVKRICTLALARSLWPEADNHTQVALCYMLHGEKIRYLVRYAHSALEDVRICHVLLESITEKLRPNQHLCNFEELWQHSETARVPTVMPFGKHKGMPLEHVPAGYKKWLLGQSDVDPYLRQALENGANRRKLL